MSKKIIISRIAVMVFCASLLPVNSFAVTLLTEKEALKEMFPDVDEVVTETVTLTDSEITRIKEILGGSLVHYQKGSQSESVQEKTEITFYIGIKNNKKIRMAVMEVQPGKWGPVKFIIAVETNPGKVNNLAVMAYKEKRGRPIARRNFLKQFIGKTSVNPISVRSGKGIRRDIRAISGATISSDSTCFAVKKVLALYEEIFIKNNL